jgi:hypothetical protein
MARLAVRYVPRAAANPGRGPGSPRIRTCTCWWAWDITISPARAPEGVGRNQEQHFDRLLRRMPHGPYRFDGRREVSCGSREIRAGSDAEMRSRGRSGCASVIGYLEFEPGDHLIALSIERDQKERFLDCSCRHERVKHTKPVGFCISLQQPVGSRSNAVGQRQGRVKREEPVDRRKVPLVASAHDKTALRENSRNRQLAET